MDAGQILLKHGLLDDTSLAKAADAQVNGSRLDQTAVELGLVTESDALKAWGAEVGMDLVDMESTEVDLSLLAEFPHKLIHRHGLFPLERRNGSVVVATSDPLNLYPLDEAGAALGLTIEPVLAPREAIAKRVKLHLGVGSETIEGLLAQREEEEEIELLEEIISDGSEISEEAQEASVVRLVNEILIEAVDLRASDVHIESQPSGVKIRYRIDGMLHQQPTPQEINQFQAAIISRLKIMARLNIAEKTPAAGRTYQAESPRARGRRACVGHSDAARRRDRHASARQGQHGVLARKTGHEPRPAQPVRPPNSPAARHCASHRPNRFG